MKPFHRSLATFTALGLALLAVAPVWALRLDAPTPDGKVTQLTAQLLEQAQFARHRFDDGLAAKFLDRYLDSLDPTHEVFLQSDAAEFHRFVPQLAEATRGQGDTHPARLIFARYLQRIDERAAFVVEALAAEKFDFTGHDHYSFDRENAPAPSDAGSARELWRQRLRESMQGQRDRRRAG